MCSANAFGRRLDISWHRMLDAHIYIWFPLPIQLAIFDTHTDTKHTVGFMPLRYWNTFCSSSIQFFSGKEEQIQKKNRAIPKASSDDASLHICPHLHIRSNEYIHIQYPSYTVRHTRIYTMMRLMMEM